MDLTLEIIERALQIEDFDAPAAHREMAPQPRQLVRLPEQSGDAQWVRFTLPTLGTTPTVAEAIVFTGADGSGYE